MSEAGELRRYQLEASAASAGRSAVNPLSVADLAAKALERDRRGWPAECLEAERKFGDRSARLYPLIDVAGGVMTPQGQGTLFNVRSDGCQVLLTRGRKTGRRQSGERYRPLREFPVEAIKPYRTPTGRGVR